jgi:DNA-3-methyladenine glycosylase I
MSDRTGTVRCGWCGADPLYVDYHDSEWGVPLRDDRRLFEMLILEGAQAGLSWITILRKRQAYREAFDEFDPERIARYPQRRVDALLKNPGIVRNRLKVAATVSNAQAFLDVLESEDSFSDYIWRFVDGRPVINRWKTMGEVPASTARSDTMSRELKKRGFRFVGSTICYAFMQATGMVNDHVTACFRHRELAGAETR